MAEILSVEDDRQKSSEIAAVQTMAVSSGPRPLKVTKVGDLGIDYEKFKYLQQKD